MTTQNNELKTTVSQEVMAEISIIADTIGQSKQEVARRLLDIALDRLDFTNRSAYKQQKNIRE